MKIVGALPDTWRGKHQAAKQVQHPPGQRVFPKNRMMLIIVVEHERPEKQQAQQYAQSKLQPAKLRKKQDAGKTGGRKQPGGQQMKPTAGAVFFGKLPGSINEGKIVHIGIA